MFHYLTHTSVSEKDREILTYFIVRSQFDENGGLLIPDKHHTIASFNNKVETDCLVLVIHIITNISLNFFIILVLQLQFSFLNGKKMRKRITLTSVMK